MKALVLDTHAALWWSFCPEKLSAPAARAVEAAEYLVLPSIVFWETSLLVRKKRLTLAISTQEWLRQLRSLARVKVVALTAELGLLADTLPMHDDPADRFVVATALRTRAPLVTRDTAIQAARVVRTVW